MNRRKFLGATGAAVSGTNIKQKMKGNGKKVASSLFSQIGLEYEVLSGNLEKIKKVHIDTFPNYWVKNKKLLIPDQNEGQIHDIKENNVSVDFRGLNRDADESRDRTGILPVETGSRGQPTVGLALENRIELPEFELHQVGPDIIRARALDSETKLKPNEKTTVIGNRNNYKLNHTGSEESVEITSRPQMTIINRGKMEVQSITSG